MKKGILCVVAILLSFTSGHSASVDEYVEVIRKQGQDPISFIRQSLETHDLIIFDDAIHSAQEPFDFYETVLHDPQIRKQIDYIFIEVFSLADQPHIDAYFANSTNDITKLHKVFQDDYSGFGWSYQTYLDLLSTIHDINKQLPESEKLQVIGVNPPIYWEAIHTRKDYEIFQDSLVGRDYLMYRVMLDRLDEFRSGKKGIFLTNTRHAYKHLRKSDGNLFWNCATFFDQNHPNKMLSIRFHNVTLHIEKLSEKKGQRTAQGLEDVEYKWVRMESGHWDEAFKRNGNSPVAVPLSGNVFGSTPYVGNLMLTAGQGQMMQDVHDAILFLAPLEQLHLSAKSGFLYTTTFRQELKRRIQILEGNRMREFLQENEVQSLDELLKILAEGEPKKKSPLYTLAMKN